MKVAIQGIAGAFHEQAAKKLLGPDIELVPCPTFRDVFAATVSGQADCGVVAVENSLYGSINPVYYQLKQGTVWVAGEVFLPIEQYLIGTRDHDKNPGTIKRVLSQAPALAQCELWLKANLPQARLEETEDTAKSVRDVVDQNDPTQAAIAGKAAAELYKGTILAGPINDDPYNYTRFLLINKGEKFVENANKTSIILELEHKPGSLYHALGAFADASINLSKLDSLPIIGDTQHLLHYAFYLDFEAGLNPDFSHPVLDKLRGQGSKITVLGSYQAGSI